jgi:predicted RNA binding protein YcfA (HicA-like mRNA interferase family)
MKRRALVKHIEAHGCRVKREGGNHTIYVGPSGRPVPVPRHTEIPNKLAREICEQLGVPPP